MRSDFKGSIFLARKIVESDIFFSKPDVWFKIWVFILLMANHRDNKQFKRGECYTNYEEIRFYTKATRNEVDHCIRWLKQAKQIATRKATRGLYIKIEKYEVYQKLDSYKSDTESDVKSDLKAKQKRNRGDTINKNENNDKNENNVHTGAPKRAGSKKSQFSPLGAELIKAFEGVDPKNKTYYSNTTQREAAEFLIREYGFEEVVKRVGFLPKANKSNFFPHITSPYELKEKWMSLEDAVERKRQERKSKQPQVIIT